AAPAAALASGRAGFLGAGMPFLLLLLLLLLLRLFGVGRLLHVRFLLRHRLYGGFGGGGAGRGLALHDRIVLGAQLLVGLDSDIDAEAGFQFDKRNAFVVEKVKR